MAVFLEKAHSAAHESNGEADMVAVALNPARRKVGYFYVWMAAVSALLAFGGFAPTYWLQLPAGTFVGSPLLHLHGVLFSAWVLFFLSQTVLAANGQLDHHRAWGLVGISLATAMVVIGLAAAINTLMIALAAGYGDSARAFFILPVSAISLFAGFIVAAIANIQRPEVHKRLMLLATISLLQAAMGRVFFVLATGGGPGLRPGLGQPPPLIIGLVPSLLLELMIVAGMVYDWRTRGRPHPIWLIGAAVMTAVILLRGPLSGTAGWLAFADAIAHFGG
jgi:general stress protein CsbA